MEGKTTTTKQKTKCTYCVSGEKKKNDSKTLCEKKMTIFAELIKDTNP